MDRPGASPPVRLLACFSHLRWDLVFQRPQHLLTRAARAQAVLFVEEPVTGARREPELALRRDPSGVEIATPCLPESVPDPAACVAGLVGTRIAEIAPDELVAWYYTPMALDYSGELRPDLVVYDCMDELSNFKDPPPGLTEREDRLFGRADLVFTGGFSLYEAKRRRHPRVFAFPSSVDVPHFAQARGAVADPADQAAIPRPRIGFFGVIDERMDLDLVAHAARACPEIQFVMLGPIAKIDAASLPQGPNVHWLGPKRYPELPAYLAHWDAGWMPFALDASTRFISPTKTPEFLAAGLPVTSTAVADVVRGYGTTGTVAIADRNSIAEKLRASIAPPDPGWAARVEAQLAQTSWDRTWAEMESHLDRLLAQRIPLERKGA